MMKNLYIYQASAGSGKTRTLVQEYLILAFKNPGNYKHILAVTFTNKATEEMKTRIIDYLVKLSEGNDEKLAQDIISTLKQRGWYSKTFDISKTAAQVLSGILHDYSSFNISTIDSFCVRIIKAFAKELGLPVGFNLELDTDMVLDEITSSMLDSIDTDYLLTKYLSEYLDSRLDDEKTWNIDKDIKEFGKQIVSENFWLRKLNSTEDVYDDKNKVLELVNDIRQVKFSYENNLKLKSHSIIELINQEGLTHADLAGGSKSGILAYCEKLQKGPAEPYKTLTKYFNEGKSFFKNNAKIENDVIRFYSEIIHLISTQARSYNTANIIFKTIYNIGILGDLLRFLNSYRKKNRTILSTDINSFLRLLISDDISPFIYEKLGIKLNYFMLDEFQDTSRFQWDNLKPLIINSLSENNNSLIVGDVKQSIYRWRNGDMRLLLYGVKRDLHAFSSMISEESLKTNWRSHKQIVDFNNRFFLTLKNRFANLDDSSNEYMIQSYEENSTKQLISGEKTDGYVEVNFYEEDKETGISANEQSEKRVTEIINEILKDNYSLGDVLVLVRKTKDGREISESIAKAGYSVVSEQSLLLISSAKINFIVSTLKYLNDSRNKLSRTEMLYNYNQIKNLNYSNSDILNDSIELNGKIFVEIMPDEFFKDDEKPKHLPVLYNLTVYELVEHIISIFELNNDADPYIVKFLEEVNRFAQEKESDIYSFLDYWEDNKHKLSISVPDNMNSVRVMTIHKSKGLESRIVIIPYANWSIEIDGNKDKIWASTSEAPFNKASAYYVKAVKEAKSTYFEKDYLEESKLVRLDNINLLYVSMTRPTDRLYLNVPVKSVSSIADSIKSSIESDFEVKNNKLILGERTIFKDEDNGKSKNKIRKEFIKLESINSSPYFKKLFIRPSYRKLKVIGNERFRLKTDNGVVVHKLLSYITTKHDIDSALIKGLMEGIISSAEKEKFKTLLTKTTESEETRDWFDGSYSVKSESEILTTDNRILRPDRVMMKNDCTVIVDYKTGREEQKHSSQLDEYAEILSEMGYKKVHKYLLYITDKANEIKIKVKDLNGGMNE
ncbi:MAG: UvrD-helicase domain-containing protein [Ignavibacteria bacterium]